MSGTDVPQGPPPDLPEEFQAAYAEAYRRALETGEAPPASSDAGDRGDFEYLFAGSSATLEQYEVAPGAQPPPRRTAIAMVAAAALVLLIAGFALSRMLGSDDDPEAAVVADETPSAPTTKDAESGKTDEPSPTATATGALVPVLATAADASCTAPPSSDAAGNKVTYPAANAIDGDDTTAWRCVGDGKNVRLVFQLPPDTRLAEVGIIPGYAKTDPASGDDRYAENNRITLVRWTLGDGVQIEQQLNPDPDRRDVQTLTVPVTSTGSVELEILATDKGRRNNTAISTVTFAAAG